MGKLPRRRSTNIGMSPRHGGSFNVGMSPRPGLGGGQDAEKFGLAFEAHDVQAFVELLSSKESIAAFDERMHPWAENPKTIGTLAGTQLAILASHDDHSHEDHASIKWQVHEAGAIAPLVNFLRSD